jgi:hypothetical protein
MQKVVYVKFPPKGPWYEVQPDEKTVLKREDDRLIIEGATLCLVEQSKQPK